MDMQDEDGGNMHMRSGAWRRRGQERGARGRGTMQEKRRAEERATNQMRRDAARGSWCRASSPGRERRGPSLQSGQRYNGVEGR